MLCSDSVAGRLKNDQRIITINSNNLAVHLDVKICLSIVLAIVGAMLLHCLNKTKQPTIARTIMMYLSIVHLLALPIPSILGSFQGCAMIRSREAMPHLP